MIEQIFPDSDMCRHIARARQEAIERATGGQAVRAVPVDDDLAGVIDSSQMSECPSQEEASDGQ